MSIELLKYISEHSDNEPELLQELVREANVKLLHPHMISGHIQGRFLSMLSRILQPKRILEIGTYAGYSALCLAEGLSAEGKMFTLDIDDEIEDFTRSFFNRSEYKNKIEFIIGDALQTIETLNETFDLIFIDANKRHYIEYYNAIFDKLSPNGLILADNTLWSGKVIEKVASNDYQTQALIKFNDYIKNDNRVTKVILPIRDGITFIRKK